MTTIDITNIIGLSYPYDILGIIETNMGYVSPIMSKYRIK